jgi:catalase (peroxidase I)
MTPGGAGPSACLTSIFCNSSNHARYGDKELKIATVNKIRQNVRNECANDLSLIVPLFQLSLADAFSYDPATNTGGIDGSILYEMDRPSSKGLEKAAAKVKQLHADLARTTEITYSDVVAFAGAAAIEAVGGPKMNVQLGRDDAKGAEPEGRRAGFSWVSPTLEGFQRLCAGVGLSNSEVVALIGTLGTLELAAEPVGDDSLLEEEDDEVDAAGRAAAAEVGAGSGDAVYGKARAKGPKVRLMRPWDGGGVGGGGGRARGVRSGWGRGLGMLCMARRGPREPRYKLAHYHTRKPYTTMPKGDRC